MPDRIRLPFHIPIGAAVFEVSYAHPLIDGIRLREMRVASIGLEKRGGYQAAPTHICEHLDGAWPGTSFVFDRDDCGDPAVPVDACSRLFLDLGSALGHVREVSDALRAAADSSPTKPENVRTA